MSNFLPDTLQRKALEKVYARVFDVVNAQRGKLPELTPEGKILVQQAKVDPEDLAIKTLDDFRNTVHQTKSSPQKGKVPAPSPSIFKGMNSLPDDNKKAVTDPEIIKKQQEIQKEATARELEEVAKIRFEHHQIKRLRKLQAINNVAEQAAARKKMEKEMAEKEYYNK